MTITTVATYENGVLKLASPLPLKEHEEVRIIVEVQPHPSMADGKGSSDSIDPLLELVSDLTRNVPEEVVDRWPTDGASQVDHYLYGAPKRAE